MKWVHCLLPLVPKRLPVCCRSYQGIGHCKHKQYGILLAYDTMHALRGAKQSHRMKSNFSFFMTLPWKDKSVLCGFGQCRNKRFRYAAHNAHQIICENLWCMRKPVSGAIIHKTTRIFSFARRKCHKQRLPVRCPRYDACMTVIVLCSCFEKRKSD